MRVIIVYKSSSSLLWLIFKKKGVQINNFRLDSGKESIFLSYPDFEPYRTILLKERKRGKNPQHSAAD
ncbi:MAG: hypothetical protein ACFFBY_07765 [Promethearchaeota archaeon]